MSVSFYIPEHAKALAQKALEVKPEKKDDRSELDKLSAKVDSLIAYITECKMKEQEATKQAETLEFNYNKIFEEYVSLDARFSDLQDRFEQLQKENEHLKEKSAEVPKPVEVPVNSPRGGREASDLGASAPRVEKKVAKAPVKPPVRTVAKAVPKLVRGSK